MHCEEFFDVWVDCDVSLSCVVFVVRVVAMVREEVHVTVRSVSPWFEPIPEDCLDVLSACGVIHHPQLFSVFLEPKLSVDPFWAHEPREVAAHASERDYRKCVVFAVAKEAGAMEAWLGGDCGRDQ